MLINVITLIKQICTKEIAKAVSELTRNSFYFLADLEHQNSF